MQYLTSLSLAALCAVALVGAVEEIKECFPAKDSVSNGCEVGMECCIPEMEFFKMSRREIVGEKVEDLPKLIDPVLPWGNRQGRCVPYYQEGENCYSMATWQTCGCVEGLTCQYTPHPDEELRRAIPPWLRPKGKHACVKAA